MATIRDVAREAQVSEGTVSNVFNNRPYVTPETRQKVLDAAERVGYQRNTLARALRLGHGNVLGLCLRDISNPTFGTIVLGIEAVARERDFQVILGNSAGDPGVESSYLTEFLSQQVAGIITAPVLDDPEMYRGIARGGTPVVFINERPGGVEADLVKHDYARGTQLATEHLLARGHQRIGIVLGPPFAAPGKEQLAAYLAAHAAAGVEPVEELQVFSRLGHQSTYSVARSLLTLSDPPTALIGSTLAITLGCVSAMTELDLQPEFVGTGDEEWLHMFPALTFVRQRSEHLGRVAVEQLLARVDGTADEEPTETVLPVELVIRTKNRGAE